MNGHRLYSFDKWLYLVTSISFSFTISTIATQTIYTRPLSMNLFHYLKIYRGNSKVIIAGDFNIDLLKINENVTLGDYLNSLVAQSFYPQITLPTRFSDRNCTLIDNFLCKLTCSFLPSTSSILISRISDHLPYFIFLDFIKSKQYDTAKTILVQNWNAVNIQNFPNELNNASIYDALDNSLENDP